MVRLAVLGHPLLYTLSPELHRAAFRALGIAGESVALPTPVLLLAERLAELTRDGFTGCNLTIPLKEAALTIVGRLSERARASHSVNTVGFDEQGSWGETTDGPGFVEWLATLERSPRGERVHLLGGGGAARSVALALREAGAEVTASVRKPEAHAEAWKELARVVAWRSDEEAALVGRATVVVNATPLEEPEAILPLGGVPAAALVVDLRYGQSSTPWVAAARHRGLVAHDGLGTLVHQARLSLELWLGRSILPEPLERAVGVAG